MTPGKSKITTIKLENSTKNRIEKLRSYKRETYDEILQKLLQILNICKVNPELARAKLIALDRAHKRAEKYSSKPQEVPKEKSVQQSSNQSIKKEPKEK